MALIDIDHIMCSVRSAQDAGQTYEKFGFYVTPRSPMIGLSNRLVCFNPQEDVCCNYLELLCIEDKDTAPEIMNKVLSEVERPASMVLSSVDAFEEEKRLADLGLNPLPAFYISRLWDLPNGETIKAEFNVCIPEPGHSPIYWNLCQHLTKQHYVRPDFTAHPNSAERLTHIYALSPEPEKDGAQLAKEWQCSSENMPWGTRVKFFHVALDIFTPQSLDDFFPGCQVPEHSEKTIIAGYAVQVKEIARLKACLEQNNVPYTHNENGDVWIAPQSAHGSLIVFREGV